MPTDAAPARKLAPREYRRPGAIRQTKKCGRQFSGPKRKYGGLWTRRRGWELGPLTSLPPKQAAPHQCLPNRRYPGSSVSRDRSHRQDHPCPGNDDVMVHWVMEKKRQPSRAGPGQLRHGADFSLLSHAGHTTTSLSSTSRPGERRFEAVAQDQRFCVALQAAT